MTFARVALMTCVLGLATSMLGCDVDSASADAEALDAEQLHERFACDDVTMVVAAADGREALLIGIEDGLAASALASEGPVVGDYELPDDRLTVRWVSGTNVFQGQCGRDTGEPWEIDERLDALSGHLRVMIEPGDDGKLRLSARVEDVELGELYIGHTHLDLPLE